MSSTPGPIPDAGRAGDGGDAGLGVAVGLRSLGPEPTPGGHSAPEHRTYTYRTDIDQSHHSAGLHFQLQGPAADKAVADPASTASDGDDVLHLLNSTDGELSGLSHLDAPISDSVYIVCGVLIAMVLVGLIIVLLAVTISKLRKREETNNNSLGHGTVHGTHPTRTHPAHPLPQLQTSDSAKVAFAQSHPGNGVATLEAATIVTTTAAVATATAITAITASTVVTASACADGADGTDGTAAEDGADEDEPDGKAPPLELFLWSYPAQQLSPYSGTKDTLVRELPCEVPQDSKGLRKNLRGKWKRLVKRKPEDTCSIPPELRDQLKQIYVY